MNVGEIRAHPRLVLDLDEEDLPDSMLDVWMREGFTRMIHLSKRLPFYESQVALTLLTGVQEYDRPGGVERLRGVQQSDGRSLQWKDYAVAQAEYTQLDGTVRNAPPRVFTEWATKLQFWPKPDRDYVVQLIGYREPSYDWVGNPGSDPDIPVDFHELLLSWVMYRTYQQQDDPTMAQIELQNFQTGFDAITPDELEPPQTTPMTLVMGGTGARRGNGLPVRQPYPFER